jgi:circadian clock protein KaiB
MTMTSSSAIATPLPEALHVRQTGEKLSLRLYIAGATPKSRLALANLRAICVEHLDGNYELEVVDIFVQPERARADDIVAVPLLVKDKPEPYAVVVGDLSDLAHVLRVLDVAPRLR